MFKISLYSWLTVAEHRCPVTHRSRTTAISRENKWINNSWHYKITSIFTILNLHKHQPSITMQDVKRCSVHNGTAEDSGEGTKSGWHKFTLLYTVIFWIMTLCCIHNTIIHKRTTWYYSWNTCDSICLCITDSNKLFYPEDGSLLGCYTVSFYKYSSDPISAGSKTYKIYTKPQTILNAIYNMIFV
jgi:hypothetical protein